MVGWVAGQQPVLPGGQNSGQKNSKGPEKKKKFAGRICGRKLAELFPELAKLFLCTGWKIISGLGNTGSSIHTATAEYRLLD
jgi:hypothetical protein